MQVRLEVSHKSGKKKTVNIHSDAVIGRSTECSLRIASGEISRKHCKLTVIESGVLVRDLESANGTWINGVMIPPNRDVALPPGSRLSIGPVQFVVHYESSNPAIEQPGSTIEMPVVRAVPDSDAVPAADVPETEPAAKTEPAATTEPVEAVEPVEAAEAEAAEVAEVVDDAPTEVAEPPAKSKVGSMFGGLLKFGRKSKDKPAEAESPATDADTADEIPAAAETGETPPTDEEQLDFGAVAEAATEHAADTEEAEYADEDEDEEEVDSELGDFFNQFEE